VSRALVIIPTYNERESLSGVLDRLTAAATDVDVLVVDDASPDGTGSIASAYAERNLRVHVLHRPSKQGLGPAYIAGFQWAFERDYAFVVELDADGSHDPAVVPKLLRLATSTGADLVIGSRWIPGGAVDGWSVVRQLISRAGNTYARFALRSHIGDLTAGFRAIRVERLRALDLASIASSGYCFQIEIADRIERAGGHIIEHPIRFVEREHGTSKMHLGIVLEAFSRITTWGLRRLVGRY
jgi:dolichol-phosphate mannosyltransferase